MKKETFAEKWDREFREREQSANETALCQAANESLCPKLWLASILVFLAVLSLGLWGMAAVDFVMWIFGK